MISFIVPAHNEERLLARTLTAIDAAARPLDLPFEVVVVDDSSTDRTASIAHEHAARLVRVSNRQIAATRNAGARESSGEMLVFVDADTIVTPAVVRAAVLAMREGAAGGGCAFRFDGRLPLYGRVLEAVAVPLYRVAGLASGCFLFCTRAAFLATGGFDERLYGAEEAVMSRALRRHGRFVVLPESVTTSGRKLRAYSGREVLGTMIGLAVGGRRSVRRREGLEIWYGERRADPESDREPARGGSASRRPYEEQSVHSSRRLRRIACLGACLLAQLTEAPPSRADSPLPPPARYSRCSPSGAFCFTADPRTGTSVHAAKEPARSLWTLPAWHRVAYVSDDGEHLVIGFDGVNLVPVDDPEQVRIVQFWNRGKLTKGYTLRDLGYQRDALQRTVSHYAWGSYEGFDARGHFRLRMIDGVSLVFDPASGALLERVAPAADPRER